MHAANGTVVTVPMPAYDRLGSERSYRLGDGTSTEGNVCVNQDSPDWIVSRRNLLCIQ